MRVSYSSMCETVSPIDRLLPVQGPRVAVGTSMCEILSDGFFPVVGVEALDMLPRVARLAVYRVSIIVRESADTLDSVWFFLTPFCLCWRLILDEWIWNGVGECLTRSRNESRQRCRLFGHNLNVARRIDGPGGTRGGGNVEG